MITTIAASLLSLSCSKVGGRVRISARASSRSATRPPSAPLAFLPRVAAAASLSACASPAFARVSRVHRAPPLAPPAGRGGFSAMGAVSSKDDHGDSTDANGGGRGSQGREYVEMGPRIMKVFPDEPGFDPRRDWDIVCDVRSPAEWEDDHVPGSVSTPVLDNEERARVGTIYKQESPFLAKKLGASLVAKNLGKILDEHFQDKEKDTRVLVYCWRGGERSMSLAHVLSRVGFKVGLIPGGYKRYRAGVLEFLRTMDGFRYHLIAGKTGCAKGKMLDQLKAQGAQVLDLEAMAQHRGSVLGEDPAWDNKQPSQKFFDTRIWEQARTFDRSRPIFVEGESSMIGRLQIPKNTWAGMRKGSVTLLEVPMESRVRWIRGGYKHFETTDVSRLVEKLQKLVPKCGKKKVAEWEEMIAAERWDEFVEDILLNHYDSAYADAAKRSGRDDKNAEFLMLPDTEDKTYARAAAELIAKHDVSAPPPIVVEREAEKEEVAA